MRPIERLAELDFEQGLRCVGFRLPSAERLRGDANLYGIALRYGLIGSSASRHLIETAGRGESRLVGDAIMAWQERVEQHLRGDLAHRLPSRDDRDLPAFIARWSLPIVQNSVPLHRAGCPLKACLEIGANEFIHSHEGQILSAWPWLARRKGLRDFRADASFAVDMAFNFFERRQRVWKKYGKLLCWANNAAPHAIFYIIGTRYI